MPRLSIIIPAPDCTIQLETTLVSALEHRPVDCELIVVHDGTYSDPYHLGDEVVFVEVPQGAGWARCVNAGVQTCEGEIVHVLSCGVQVTAGWTDSAWKHFQDPQIGLLSPILCSAEDHSIILATGVTYGCGGSRRVCTEIGADSTAARRIFGPTRTASYIRRAALIAVGGYSEVVGDQLTDIDLALSLKAIGFRSAVASDCRVLARGVSVPDSPDFLSGLRAEVMFWRHAATNGWLKSLSAHPLTWAAEFFTGLPRPATLLATAGRMVGLLFAPSACLHQRRLEAIFQKDMSRARESRAGHLRVDSAHGGTNLGVSSTNTRQRT